MTMYYRDFGFGLFDSDFDFGRVADHVAAQFFIERNDSGSDKLFQGSTEWLRNGFSRLTNGRA